MNILRLLTVADLLTVANLSSGILAIFLANQQHFGISALLIALAVAFDSLDGRVAVWMHQQHEFGKQLDSLADLVSFGVAPAYLYFAMGPHEWPVIIALLFFAACGMLRLARYNISDADSFEGVPITVNGVLFPALYALSLLLPNSLKYWSVVFLLMGLLMVSSIRVRRLF